MKAHISKKKRLFTISVIGLIAVIIAGGLLLKYNNSFSWKSFQQKLAYLKYEIIFGGKLKNDNTVDSNTIKGVPVLLYHGIENTPGQFTINQKQFADEMSTLKKAGYTTISVDDFYQFLEGKKQLPDKSFLLTFDDARRDSYLGADPVLKALGYHAVMFVPTADVLDSKNTGSGYYLDEKQLKTMMDSGRWEFGSHAMQQTGDSVPVNAKGDRKDFLSNKEWLADKGRLETDTEYDARINQELTQSKTDLEKDLGVSITAFAYPSSDYGQQSTNNKQHAEAVIAKYIAKNYEMAFQQVSPTDNQFTLNYPGDTMLLLHRIEPGNDWDGQKVLNTLEAAGAKLLPDDTMFGVTNVWKRVWGTITQNADSIVLTTSAERSGSETFLDGTKNWRNYQYQTTVKGDAVEAVTLYARYQDENNNLSCTFTNTYVKTSETIAGVTTVLDQVKYSGANTLGGTFGIAVNDKGIVCSQNATAIMGSVHDNKLKNGGIGLGVWDSILKARNITFSNISASEVSTITLPPKLATPHPVTGPTEKPPQGNTQTPVVPPVVTPTPTPNPTQPDPTSVALSLPYKVGDFSVSALWKDLYGLVSVKDNRLSVGASTTTTGGFAELPGSEGWTNYNFAIKPNFISGTSFSLVARYKDSKNYTMCTFEQHGYARIDSVVNGKQTKIVELKNQISTIPNVYGINYSMSVDGQNVRCLVNDQVVTADVHAMAAAGGIGIKVYNKAPGTSVLNIDEVNVSQL